MVVHNLIVVDTNILVYFWLDGDHSPSVESLFKQNPIWEAPILWRSEFRNVMSLYLRKNLLNQNQVRKIISNAEDSMSGHEHLLSSDDIMPLVGKSNCSAYDCEFVALAKKLKTKLYTFDKKIIKEFPKLAKAP